MIRRVLLILAALAALTHSPAAAQRLAPISYTELRNRADLTFDPGKAYVLIVTGMGAEIELVKQATPAERALWQLDRQEALAQAQAAFPAALADHERRSARGRASVVPPRAPTDATFSWPPAESLMRVRVSVLRAFARESGAALFLYEVPPGTYYFYAYNNIMTRECLCMGSVSFPVEAGAITAVRVDRRFLGTDGQVLAERERGVGDMERWVRSGVALSAVIPAAVHPRIPASLIRPARLSPVPELPNWGGYIVNRALPIPGLFRYDRDRMIVENGSPD